MKKILFALCFLPVFLFAQKDSTKTIVKIAGVTVTADSLKPVPFVNVLIKGNYSGTMGDYSGFYSIVAKAGDTLIFSSIGYKREEYIIPDTLQNKQYSLIQMLEKDVIELPETRINVWPSYEQFKQAFLNTEMKDSDLARAKKNLSHEVLREHAINSTIGAGGNQTLMQDQHKARLYSIGQMPQNNFLNPLAWNRLIQAWKNGEFEKE